MAIKLDVFKKSTCSLSEKLALKYIFLHGRYIRPNGMDLLENPGLQIAVTYTML